MPWFCHTSSKKRSNKARVGGVGRKSGRKEIERRATFVVVVENFTASRRDELSVHRGQVVEVICTKGNLVYVRDMNSSVGYVPKDHTLDIERIEGTFTNGNIGNGQNTILSGDSNITGPALHPRLIDVSTLQRSGSSVNSVDLHRVSSVSVTEVRDEAEGQETPTSLSPQVIYEVPRYPDGTSVDTISKENGGIAPALPPRSACLPILAEVQSDYAHSYDHNGRQLHQPLQRHRPGSLSLSSPSSRSRYPYGPFPPTPDNPSSKSHTPSNDRTHTPGYFACSPGCSPPAWTPGATPNGYGKMRSISRTTSDNMSESAGLPASSASAHFIPTQGASDVSIDATNPIVGHGFALPSSSPTSSISPYRHRARRRSRGNRRYSCDVQVHSTISENISSEAVGNHRGEQLDMSKEVSRRLSQPCLVTDRTSTPSRRIPRRQTSQLPVNRSLSLCGPDSPFTHATTGQTSYPCTPQQQQQQQRKHPVLIRRAPSYQEAVLTTDDNRLVVSADVTPTEIVSKYLASNTIRSIDSEHSASRSQRSKSGSSLIDATQSIRASEDVADISMCPPDDVFLTDAKKPVGIYRCIRMHEPTFKGEIALRKNEMVIVLDYGKGEWAWVMTSANVEGLVPNSVLVKYHSNGNGIGAESVLPAGNGKFGIDVATQTEVPHNTPFHGSPRSASVGLSMGYSSSSMLTNESSPLSTSLRAPTSERRRGVRKEIKDEIILLEAAATAIGEHVKVQEKTHPCTPKEWFNTMDSLDETERIKPCGSHMSSLSRRVNSCSSPTQLETAAAAESSLNSKDETDADTVTPSTTETAVTTRTREVAAATGGTTTTKVVKPGTTHYHDRISGLGSVSFNNKIVSSLSPLPKPGKQPRSRQLGLSNVLTAVRNYTPPAKAKNCLTIKEGDILHLQTHMHYPKGWMWVWHTTRRSFGYVPKSYVAYTYDTIKKQRPTVETLEDDV